jgi:hypothetical protein
MPQTIQPKNGRRSSSRDLSLSPSPILQSLLNIVFSNRQKLASPKPRFLRGKRAFAPALSPKTLKSKPETLWNNRLRKSAKFFEKTTPRAKPFPPTPRRNPAKTQTWTLTLFNNPSSNSFLSRVIGR